jgi:N-acetylglucosamine kinase-like BadF-type ATPase
VYNAGSVEAAAAEVGLAVTQALAVAGLAPEDVTHATFSLAGADWPEDMLDLGAALAPLAPHAAVAVINDAIGALRAGTPDGVGVSVVCGTGGCVGARSAAGAVWHSSWWALHSGAWAIGHDALTRVYDAELGLGPQTALTEAALRTYDASSTEDVLHQFTRRGGRPDWESALFAPAVLRAALDRDEVAEALVREHGARLGSFAQVAVRKLGLEGPFPLVLLGGVLRGEGAELIVEEILARVAGGVPIRPGREPAAGALLDALDRAGAHADLAVLDGSLPGPEFYATR